MRFETLIDRICQEPHKFVTKANIATEQVRTGILNGK